MALTDLVPVPGGINISPGGQAIASAKQTTMLSLLGNPRADYGADCRPITNPKLKPLVVLRNVGPFKVTGLGPAVDSLEKVFVDIQAQKPQIFAALGNMGMLCARFVRGSNTSISNHSWGTAIDLTLDGKLDPRGDGLVQKGLIDIAPIFNSHGWYWGAGFGTEDAMHFECGDAMIRSWAGAGLLGGTVVNAASHPPASQLSLGDRGPDVVALQRALNANGASLLADGIFGRDTQTAVLAFQGMRGLEVTGVAGPKVLAELKLIAG
jgi:hypothetical protein